jgi:hypothetical protein
MELDLIEMEQAAWNLFWMRRELRSDEALVLDLEHVSDPSAVLDVEAESELPELRNE